MIVSIDDSAGFCWGVVKTIDKIEEVLESNHDDRICVLGEIIHNPREIERLEKQGLKTVSYDEMENLATHPHKLIIRAHGEPPSTYAKAEELGISLVDATCPLVQNLQKRIKKAYLDGFQIIIFGQKNHPEVIGLRGVCNDECIVLTSLDEPQLNIDYSRNTILFSQTTMERSEFNKIKSALEAKFNNLQDGAAQKFLAKDTICKYVADREQLLQNFVRDNDLVLFVAGKNSSNGKSLYNICRKANKNTHFIEGIDEIDSGWLKDVEKVGITGATSTPQWYLQLVKEEIEKMS
jgi:4-hydroxy-3-methylbut-2-en-1-yl diphosphate reductase